MNVEIGGRPEEEGVERADERDKQSFITMRQITFDSSVLPSP